MRSLVKIGAGVMIALAMSGAASAQVTGVVTSRSVSVTSLSLGQPANLFNFNSEVANGAFQYNTDTAYGSQQNLQVAAIADVGNIAFANNVTVGGTYSSASATTQVVVNYKNGSANDVDATLHSSITPAGLGFYESNPLAIDPAHAGDMNHNPESLSHDMGYTNGFQVTPVETLASSGVFFQVSDGVNTLAEYTANMLLQRNITQDSDGNYSAGAVFTTLTISSFDGVTHSEFTGTTDVAGAGAGAVLDGLVLLHDFALVGSDSFQRQVGYHWGATDLFFNLGTLASGEARSLIYLTQVYAATNAQISAADSASTDNQLLAYAGFGDPIGSNGGGGAVADPAFPLIDLGGFDFDPLTGQMSGGQFQGYEPDQLPLEQRFAPPIPDPGGGGGGGGGGGDVGGVPEPATWALMLGGFGLAGAALRRRRASLA